MTSSNNQGASPRIIPTLHIDQPEVTIDPGNGHLEALARQLISALINYPHAIVLSGMRAAAGPDRIPDVVTLVRAITNLLGGRSSRSRLSFSEIKVISAIDVNARVGTNYSRTNMGIAPHSDLSYQQPPPNLFALQCVKADHRGGETTIVPVEAVLQLLSKETIQTLRKPIFPFAEGVLKPVLSGRRAAPCISYYSTQLEKGMAAQQTSLDEASQSVLNELDQLINETTIGFKLNLRAGVLVLINNHKALHGRTAFDEDSNRLLYRVRASVDFPTPGFRFMDVCRRILNKFPHRKTYFKKTGPEGFEAAFTNHEGIFTRQKIAGTQELNEFADTRLRQGQFSLAVPAYEELIRHMPENLATSKSLSCLLEENGETEKAELVLKEAVAASPYQLDEELRAGLPVILRTSGFKNRRRILCRGLNDYQTKVTGGHFSLQNLLDTEKLNVMIMNLYDSSLDLAFPAPPFHLLLNTIAAAEWMEDALNVLIEFLEKYPDVPVINHPAQIMMTTREINYRRLSALDGVLFPDTVGFSFDGYAMEKQFDRMKEVSSNFPIMLRPTNTHTGIGVALVRDEAEFRGYLAAQGPGRYYAIAYHDLKDDRGLFNKMRTFCIDGNYYPVANLHHNDWHVHGDDRYSVMDQEAGLQDQEKAFLGDMGSYIGSENIKRLDSIREVIGLDFFGIDFTILPDGHLFLFECNAAMRHTFRHVESFPYTSSALHKITDAFGEMVKQRLSG